MALVIAAGLRILVVPRRGCTPGSASRADSGNTCSRSCGSSPAPEILRIVDVRIVVEAVPILGAVTPAPLAIKGLLCLGVARADHAPAERPHTTTRAWSGGSWNSPLISVRRRRTCRARRLSTASAAVTIGIERISRINRSTPTSGKGRGRKCPSAAASFIHLPQTNVRGGRRGYRYSIRPIISSGP